MALKAPRIDPHEALPIRCSRPTRQDAIRISCDRSDERIVTHLYGHGGSGWTLCHGSVEAGISRFCETARSDLDSRNDPFVVLGGGVIGLLTASRLAEMFGGHRVRIVAEDFADLPSHRAGGLLAPISLKTAPEAQKELNDYAHSSLLTWERIADGRLAHFAGGARRMPVYVREGSDAGLDMYVQTPRTKTLQGETQSCLLPPPVPVSVQFDTGGRYGMRRYDTMFIDTQKMMRQFHAYLDTWGVERQRDSVRRLEDLDSRYIFNCTGLGARELVGDPKVDRVWGHLLGLGPQPEPRALDYMVYADIESPSGHASANKETCYFMPKQVTEHGLGVVGGTFVAKPLEEREHLELLDGVKNRATQFFRGS